ncbi:MAG: S8 family serine peptidase, partial [Bacteroidia bacterium]
MKHIFTFFLCFGLTILLAQNAAYYASNQLIVQYKSAEAFQKSATLRSNLDVRKVNAIPALQVELWELPKSCEMGMDCLREVKEWADYLKKNENEIAIVQPNYIYGAGRSLSVAETNSLPPNDTAFYKQWYLHNTGWNGCPDSIDIGALAAWDIRKDAKFARIGIFDTGIDWKHPDLVDNIWRNLGEDADGDSTTIVWNGAQWVLDPGDLNGIDDDQNGYVDDVIGWDFVNGDNNPLDDNGHGTHVSGIIGAKQNNTLGISGIAGAGIQMMPLKCLDETGAGYSFSILLALQYSINKGAMVTNHSYGGGAFDPLIFNYIDNNCKQAGQLLVAAAGNNHVNNDTDPMYPASYDSDIIISVGAHDCNGNPSAFSNFGSNSVDIFAPGDAIYSTELNGTYSFRSGTSMAAPMATAAVVLAWKQFPASTPKQMKNRVLNASDKYINTNDISLSNAKLNLYRMLSAYNDKALNIEKGEIFHGDIRVYTIKSEGEYLWLVTRIGLIKFNVKTTEKIFYNTSTSNIASNYLTCIDIDKNGKIWLGTKSKGIIRFDGQNWNNYAIGSNLNINCITSDSQGNVWVGTNSGLFKFNGANS